MVRTATILIVGPERGLTSVFEAVSYFDIQTLIIPSVVHIPHILSFGDVDIIIISNAEETVAAEFPDTSVVCLTEDSSVTVMEYHLADDSPWWHTALMIRIKAVLTGRHVVPSETANSIVSEMFEDTEFESLTAIGQQAVTTVADAFALPYAVVALLDEEKGTLSTVAESPACQIFGIDANSFGPESQYVWRAFSTANTIRVRKKRSPVGAKHAVITSLGENGVLIAGTSHASVIDSQTIDAIELLATTTHLALDRQQAYQDRREAEHQLERQREQLDRIVDINDKIRKMDQALVQAEARSEIERIVCERLLTSDRFAFVWIGEMNNEGTEVHLQSMAGTDQGYLDSISLSLAEGESAIEPALRALETEETTIVSRVAGRNLHKEVWRGEALLRDFRAVASVPLVHREATYGVVTVYASVPAAFDTLAVSVLSEMGKTIGYAINAAEQRHALTSDTVTELTVMLPSIDDVFTRLTAQFDVPFIMDGFAVRADEATIIYGTLPGTPARDVIAMVIESPMVEEARAISRSDNRFEFVVAGSPLPVVFTDIGARLERFTTVDGRVKLTVVVPTQTVARTVVDQLANIYGDSIVQAQHTRERSLPPLPGAVAALTDRQQEVLETAYYSGYFEWPRDQTGEEIAATLDISQPAFLQHLRACERKLATGICERN